MMKKVMCLIALLAMTSMAAAIGTTISGEISSANGNDHWTTSGMPYNLQGVCYVVPGETLTIDPGVVIATYTTTTKGSLIVCRDADIYINGTMTDPVIFTSANDVATWEGSDVTIDGNGTVVGLDGGTGNVTAINTLGDPKTGTWRPVCTEWGSLAVLGKSYISASEYEDGDVSWTANDGSTYTNTECPSAYNRKVMEGTTVPTTMGEQERVLYGGDDDNDNSGSIKYVSFRYGGQVLAEASELNGLSLGAIGRATDIHHVDIMNNVDDGIEIWGGTVQLDHINIWNIGDDSLDFDEGWRGCAEYGLIVQGYSQLVAKGQGSGIGDNAFEHDGAEEADVHPMSTVKISKFTVVGQPGDEVTVDGITYDEGSDKGCAFRDNARVQYDSCLWVDGDDKLIGFDNADKDGAHGYDGTASDGDDGYGLRDNIPADGTLNWRDHWMVSYNTWKELDGATTGFEAYPYSLSPAIPGTLTTYYPTSTPNGCTVDLEDMYADYICTDLDGTLCQITNSAEYSYKTDERDELTSLGVDSSSLDVEVLSENPLGIVRDTAVTYTTSKPQYIVMYPVSFINPIPDKTMTTAGGFECNNWIAGWTAASAFGMTAPSADLDCSGTTDLVDFSILAGQWLN